MPIEFRCTGCQQQLRVPDTSAGKNAKCPKCGAVVIVPAGLGAPLPGFGPPSSGFTPSPLPPSPSQPLPSPFSDSAKPAPGASPFSSSPTGASPFAPGGAGGYSSGGGAPNPYASPQAASYQPPISAPGGPIVNQQVSVEQVFNYAWQIWQVNLGLLVGVTLVVAVITNGVSYLFQGIEFALRQNDAPEAAVGVSVLAFGMNIVVQTFLGIGQTQIMLKLVRRQPADFSELFGGGAMFLPILGFNILYGLAVGVGLVLLIVPGIILLLMWWPAYYLVLERKAGVFESFSLATEVTRNNWGTAFVMALLSFCIMLLGCLACIIGMLFAAPLIGVMWTTAYLMMSGQLMPYGQQPMPGQFSGQPMPGKWS
jgi:hypothetical protein